LINEKKTWKPKVSKLFWQDFRNELTAIALMHCWKTLF